MSESERGARRGSMRDMLALYRDQLPLFALGTFLTLLGRLVAMAFPAIVAAAVDWGLHEGGGQLLVWLSLSLLGLIVVRMLATWGSGYYSGLVGVRIVNEMRENILTAIMGMTPDWLRDRSPGELVGRLAADGATVIRITPSLMMAIADCVKLVVGIALLFLTALELAGWVLGIVPIVLVVVQVAASALRRRGHELRDAEGAASARAEAILSTFWTVKAFGREEAERAAYAERLDEVERSLGRYANLMGVYQGALIGASSLVVVVVVWAGGNGLADGQLTPGTLVAFLMYTFLVTEAASSISTQWGQMSAAQGSMARVLELAGLTPDDVDPPTPRPLPESGEIEVTDLTVAYPSNPETPALAGVSLRVSRGEMVALVGRSGAGKSTLVSALLRFTRPRSGQIRLGGVDIAELGRRDLRDAIAVVPQEPVLFPTTIGANIRHGRADASQAEVEEAARRAHAHDFIVGLPQGYDTLVGQRGEKLSGGQRQRIALARALVTRPRILVLDEATSSLDAESEAGIQAALEEFARAHSALVIAHRLNTVKHADRIYVFDEGRIVEAGTHAELLGLGRFYRRLVSMQLHGAERSEAATRP